MKITRVEFQGMYVQRNAVLRFQLYHLYEWINAAYVNSSGAYSDK